MIANQPPTGPRAEPDNWDRLRDPGGDRVDPPEPDVPRDEAAGTPAMTVIAGSWGDLASLLGLCAACLVALKLGGHGAPLAALPWAAALALVWWCAAASALVVVRHGTPGMLMAGLTFTQPLSRRRIPWVILTALVLCATLGIPAALSSRGWPLSMAGGVAVSPTARDAS
jgi:hypothetical protein